MARRGILGLFRDADGAAEAVDWLRRSQFSSEEFEVLTGSPYPEGAFGEGHIKHRLFIFPFVGAALGFAVAILLNIGTQVSYPIVTGGKPILSLPPMTIITYEGTLLGAILFTVLGIVFESRLPSRLPKIYDPRISDGYIGVMVACPEERLNEVDRGLRQAGAADVKWEPGAAAKI